MSPRKRELTTAKLERDWPHHVALPAEKARGLQEQRDRAGWCR
jgi:hypothetical protein